MSEERVTPAQYETLALLEKSPLTAREISALRGAHITCVRLSLRRLEGKGLIARSGFRPGKRGHGTAFVRTQKPVEPPQ